MDSNANNVYKHGFCLQVSKSSIAIGIENKDIAIKNSGDTVINYTISRERNIWIKKISGHVKMLNQGFKTVS